MLFYAIVLFFGFIAGFLSGLLAVGGAIIIIPVFLYLIPMLGFEALPMSQITGIASMQVITGSLFAFLSHRKYGLINKSLLYTVGIGSGIAALIGSIVSKYLSGDTLLIIYSLILSVSLVVLALQKDREEHHETPLTKPVAGTVLSAISGLLSGALGVGGAVLYIPIVNYCYGMSLKVSISNVTYIVFITAIMTFLGKAATNQVPFHLAFLVIIGGFLGARLGTKVSHKMSAPVLRKILILIVVITLVRVLFSIF